MTGIEAPSPHHQSNPKLQIRQFHSNIPFPRQLLLQTTARRHNARQRQERQGCFTRSKSKPFPPIVQMKSSPFSATSEAGAEEPANCQPETGRNALPRLPDAGGQRSSSTGHTGRFGWPYRGAACRQTMPVSLQNASSKDDNVPLGFSATCTGRSRRT